MAENERSHEQEPTSKVSNSSKMKERANEY